MIIKLTDVILALSIKGLARGTLTLLVNGSAGRCHPCITIEKVIYKW